ncbi:MAG: crossover junction endodeoxyribonuclease RuvC [Lentisphaeria bacterium]|nr:crossover junction endodeoxyribonuclease RuvC [Lentisphaeria bacterium]
MIILGIDTAMRKTGYGVVEMDHNSIRVLDCGVIHNKANLKHTECVRRIFLGIRELINTFKVDAVSLETAFVNRNVKTAMILSLARGAAITSAAIEKIPVYEYSPKTAKRAAVGLGTASKEQVANVLASLCSLNVTDIPDDSTDALALAVCHGNLACRQGALAGLCKEI